MELRSSALHKLLGWPVQSLHSVPSGVISVCVCVCVSAHVCALKCDARHVSSGLSLACWQAANAWTFVIAFGGSWKRECCAGISGECSAQGPCSSSLYRSKFSDDVKESALQGEVKFTSLQ